MNLMELIVDRNRGHPRVQDDFLFSPELNLAGCFISKNASSLLKHSLFLTSKNLEPSDPVRNPHIVANSGLQSADIIGFEEMSRVLESGSVPKFILGRHPVSRFVSAYNSRVKKFHRESYDNEESDYLFRLRQRVIGAAEGGHASPFWKAMSEVPSLDDFAAYVLQTPDAELDRHVVPQSYFSFSGVVDYSIVGKLESLQDFLAQLEQSIGKKLVMPPRIQINKSVSFGTESVISEPLVSKLIERYEQDYDFFGYEKSRSWAKW